MLGFYITLIIVVILGIYLLISTTNYKNFSFLVILSLLFNFILSFTGKINLFNKPYIMGLLLLLLSLIYTFIVEKLILNESFYIENEEFYFLLFFLASSLSLNYKYLPLIYVLSCLAAYFSKRKLYTNFILYFITITNFIILFNTSRSLVKGLTFILSLSLYLYIFLEYDKYGVKNNIEKLEEDFYKE